MHPKQFQVNEVWLAFRANAAPLRTPEGAFDVFVLMDAASMYMLGTALVPVGAEAPSEQEAANLLQQGWQSRNEWPERLVLHGEPSAENGLARAAQWNGIPVVVASSQELAVYIEDVRGAFEEHFNGPANSAA
jgi:hypothetical protein